MAIKNQINREATGLLQFFRAKVGGQGPITLFETVQPVVDVQPFIGTNLIRGVTTNASGNPPANLNIAVPDGQNWFIQTIGMTLRPDAATAVGDGMQFALQIQGLIDSTGTETDCTIGIADSVNSASVSAASTNNVTLQPRGMILPSGTNIQAQLLLDDSAGSHTIYLSVIYLELTT